jgi:hypothetical protein
MEGSSQAHEVTPSRAITRTLSIPPPAPNRYTSAEGGGTIARAERVLTRPAGQRTIAQCHPRMTHCNAYSPASLAGAGFFMATGAEPR